MVVVVWPNGTTIEPPRTDGYGPRKPILTPEGWTSAFHRGTDHNLAGGKVHSVLPGTVVSVGTLGQLGLQVHVDHGVIGGHRYWSRSCHLASTRVKAGDRVSAGTVLGIEGDTGASAGRHLHWEITRDGTDRGTGTSPGDTIDPRGFILSLLARPDTDDSTPFTPDESEEDDMRNSGFYYTRASDGAIVYLLINTGSGWWSEYTDGKRGVEIGGDYNNPIAGTLGTGSFAQITESHATALKTSCDRSRGVTVSGSVTATIAG